MPRAATLALAAALSLAACRRADDARASAPLDYIPPPDSAIPAGPRGAAIRRGLALVTHTTDSLPRNAGNSLQCASCHLDAGRRREAALLSGVTARYPRFTIRTGSVIDIEARVNYCIVRSLAGDSLATSSRDMQDIVAYLAFLSTGLPAGARVVGEGMPAMPRLTGDTTRGAAVFTTSCAVCHGSNGGGAPPAIPAVWGPASYSIAASMAREERAASFIRHFMPLSNPGSLTNQQAFDVAAYVNAQPRPDSPGKQHDWPAGDAPYDVPYDTPNHLAHRPPATLVPHDRPLHVPALHAPVTTPSMRIP